MAADGLKIGDRLELQNGEDAFIEAVHHEKLAKPIQVYNFEVEDFHTYYVGPACVLVHNACKPTDIGKAGERKAGIPGDKKNLIFMNVSASRITQTRSAGSSWK